jgi:Uncharacterized conserved protein
MLFASPPWDQFVILIGEITLLVIAGILAFGIFLAFITLYSIKRGKVYFPRLLSSGFIMLEGLTKAIVGFFGLDDREMVSFFIRVHNSMNARSFEGTPLHHRAIFFPQCLRSARCPAHLTPEGLLCQGCGGCDMGKKLPLLRDLGYRVFIVPGSSFIQRMVKKYRPSSMSAWDASWRYGTAWRCATEWGCAGWAWSPCGMGAWRRWSTGTRYLMW